MSIVCIYNEITNDIYFVLFAFSQFLHFFQIACNFLQQKKSFFKQNFMSLKEKSTVQQVCVSHQTKWLSFTASKDHATSLSMP